MDNGQLDKKIYTLEDCILHCNIKDNNQEFSAIVLPENLQQAAMLLAHDHSGHNWIPQDICSTKNTVFLERNETWCPKTLQAAAVHVHYKEWNVSSLNAATSNLDNILWSSYQWI